MMRLGFTLCNTPAMAALLAQPRVALPHATQLVGVTGVHIPFRTMAKAKSDSSAKKQRYSGKVEKIKRPHYLSGNRKKVNSWLEPPRRRTVYRKRKPAKDQLYALNTPKRITHYVNIQKEEAKDRTKKLNETWLRTLANQGRNSPETAAALQDLLFRKRVLSPNEKGDIYNPKQEYAPSKLKPMTFETLLEMWARLKNVDHVMQVFHQMERENKVTDYAYSLYCTTLAKRGRLKKAKKVFEARKSRTDLTGHDTLRAMINYVAADNLSEGVELFRTWEATLKDARTLLHNEHQRKADARRKEQAGAAPAVSGAEGKQKEAEGIQEVEVKEIKANETGKVEGVTIIPSPEQVAQAKKEASTENQMYSTIIGWCLKHGDFKLAEEIYATREQLHRERCPVYTDEEFASLVKAHEKAVKERNDALGQWEEQIRKLKENSDDPDAYNKAVGSGNVPKKPRVAVPPYPVRYTQEEFLKEQPIVFTTHILRPLIDLEEAGWKDEKASERWITLIGESFKKHIHNVRPDILNLAQRIHAGKEYAARYDHLRNLLKKMGLPYEAMTRVKAPPAPPAPLQAKKPQEIKKWWRVDGPLPKPDAN